MIIRTEVEIMRGTCIGQTRRGVHYIVFESEGNSGRIAIVGDANNGIWQTINGNVNVQPNFVHGLALNRKFYSEMTIDEIETAAYNAYMSGAHS